MGRPRKNRVGEYARLLGEELGLQLQQEIIRSVAASQRAYLDELAELRSDLRKLGRRLDALMRRSRSPRGVGRWVPGGPGRPPKDAADRIAAFEARTRAVKGTRKPTRRSPRGRAGS